MLERENVLYFSSSTQLCTTLGAKLMLKVSYFKQYIQLRSSVILDLPLRPATQKRKMTDISISKVVIFYTRNSCLAEPCGTRGRMHDKKFSDRVGRDGISGFTGEVELHGHIGPEM